MGEDKGENGKAKVGNKSRVRGAGLLRNISPNIPFNVTFLEQWECLGT